MKYFLTILIVVIAIASFIFIPLFAISAINVLFGTTIAWSFINWVCVVFLTSLVTVRLESNK